MSQGIARPLTGSQLGAAGQNSVPHVGASGGAMMGKSVGNSSRGGAERPSVVAGVTDKDIEELKQQVAQASFSADRVRRRRFLCVSLFPGAQMAKEKKEIEERANRAMQDLWRYQGEVKNVRLKADEVRAVFIWCCHRHCGAQSSWNHYRKRNTPRTSLRICKSSWQTWRRC
jgi:hypothetical protein